MQKQDSQVICKSHFKNDGNTNLKERFNKKWVELINRMEKNKIRKYGA